MSQTTPIKYKIDYDPDSLTQITMSQVMTDGTTRKRKVPVAKADSIECILQVMVDFDEIAKPGVLVFDGDDYYNNFRMVLPAVMREDWDHTVRTIAPAARTEATFRTCQRQWLTTFITEGAADDLKEYIMTHMKKEMDDTILQLVTRAKVLRKRQHQLQARGAAAEPAAAAMISDRELLRAMYRGLPLDWRDNFLRNHSLETCSIITFQQFMTHEKATADRIRDVKRSQRTRDQSSRQQDNHRNNRPTTRNRDRRNNRRDNRRDNPYPSNCNNGRNHCRRHPQGNHDWINCYENPNGPNYRPGYRARNNDRGPPTRPNNGPPNQQHYYGPQTYYQQQHPPGAATTNHVPVGDGRTQGGMPYQQPMNGSYFNAGMHNFPPFGRQGW